MPVITPFACSRSEQRRLNLLFQKDYFCLADRRLLQQKIEAVLRANFDITEVRPILPSTFILKPLLPLLIREIEVIFNALLLGLYTINCFVAEPTVVKTVSNDKVSVEKANLRFGLDE
jgi:hypothetical protein